MKRTIFTILFVALASAMLPASDLFGQSRTNRLYRPCPSSTVYATLEVESDGDIAVTPCSGRTFQLPTTERVQIGTTFGASASTTSRFVIDDQSGFTTSLDYRPLYVNANSAGSGSVKTTAAITGFANYTGAGVNAIIKGGDFTAVTSNASVLQMRGISAYATASGTAGTLYGGEFQAVQSGTGTVTTTHAITAIVNAGTGGTLTTANAGHFRILTAGATVTNARNIYLQSNSGTPTNSYGIYADAGVGVGSSASYLIYSLSPSPNFFTGKNTFDATITAGGTTGNQTINKPSGTVNIAAGAGTAGLTVTNSFVTTSSIVTAVIRTNDATCAIKNVVPAAGSFVITTTANCTAETSVGFIVTN